ncbi:MAG: sigma-70 family RNA polymerase sigma factor [Anaerolineales bacterium]|nr:sigma-70 family RNA polymerase sigma factor [Anaerolineales bacterium]
MEEKETISIKALKAGDREAFAAMVDAYSPRLYKLALRMLGDSLEAEDILQEAFLKAYRGIENFRGGSKLSTWLYRITVNEALMRIRKNKLTTAPIDEPLLLEDGAEVPRELKDWCCLPEAELMSAEAQSTLDIAIDSLSPTLRAAFVLRDLQGLSTREAAEVIQISEAAIKTRLLRARLQLRESLSSYFSERMDLTSHA